MTTSLATKRKVSQPTTAELALRPSRPAQRRNRTQPRLSLMDLARRTGLSPNTVNAILKKRLLITERMERLIQEACESPAIQFPLFDKPDLFGKRDALGMGREKVVRVMPTHDNVRLHRDVLMDVENGRVEITEEMYQRFCAAIESLTVRQ